MKSNTNDAIPGELFVAAVRVHEQLQVGLRDLLFRALSGDRKSIARLDRLGVLCPDKRMRRDAREFFSSLRTRSKAMGAWHEPRASSAANAGFVDTPGSSAGEAACLTPGDQESVSQDVHHALRARIQRQTLPYLEEADP